MAYMLRPSLLLLQSDKDNIDKVRVYPSYEELMREAEMDDGSGAEPGDNMSEEERADSVIDSLLQEGDEDDDEAPSTAAE